MNIKFNKKRAFTLIELLVVISIIGLLSSVILSALNDAREKAKVSKAQQEMREIHNALILYMDKYNEGPSLNTNQNSKLVLNDCNTTHTASGNLPNGGAIDLYGDDLTEFISEIPVDPWGGRYWFDSLFRCDTGNYPTGCENQDSSDFWTFAIGSGGPNNSSANAYDTNDVVHTVCDYTN